MNPFTDFIFLSLIKCKFLWWSKVLMYIQLKWVQSINWAQTGIDFLTSDTILFS